MSFTGFLYLKFVLVTFWWKEKTAKKLFVKCSWNWLRIDLELVLLLSLSSFFHWRIIFLSVVVLKYQRGLVRLYLNVLLQDFTCQTNCSNRCLRFFLSHFRRFQKLVANAFLSLLLSSSAWLCFNVNFLAIKKKDKFVGANCDLETTTFSIPSLVGFFDPVRRLEGRGVVDRNRS